LKGVTIPMFSAKGLAIKRSNGEVVTPFYFAYEDLREDWGKLVEQAEAAEEEEGATRAVKKLAAKPKVTYCLYSLFVALLHSEKIPDIFLFWLDTSSSVPPSFNISFIYACSPSTFSLPSPHRPISLTFPITTSVFLQQILLYSSRWK
jgi:hypothetical protein